MAREPVKINSVVSSPGQVANRSAYMRPARDSSGSKALSEALGSLSGTLNNFNAQVDRYQNAQRQAEIVEARKYAEEQKHLAYLQGSQDGQAGVSVRGSALQDSPLFHAAYQEGRMLADFDRTVTEMERNTDWAAFSNDVDDGHNKLQAYLLDAGDKMAQGYSPEIQAKMLESYRKWAGGKMADQAAGARQTRISNMQEDLTSSLENILVTSGDPEAVRAAMSEQATILAKAGVANPSGKVGESLIAAATLTRDPDAIDRVLSDPEFAKTLNTDTRLKLQQARNQLDAQETAIENRERSEYNRVFRQNSAAVTMEAMKMLESGNTRGAVDTLDGMIAAAYQHPDSTVGLSVVKSLEAMKSAALAPADVKPTPTRELELRMQLNKELALATAQGASDHELLAIAAPYMEVHGLSVGNAMTAVNAANRFASEQTDSFSQELNGLVKVWTGEISGAADAIGDPNAFLSLRETDIDSNMFSNNMKFNYQTVILEEERALQAIHGPEWERHVSYTDRKAIYDNAVKRAAAQTLQDPDSGFVELLDNAKARGRLLGSPTARKLIEMGLGAEELRRLDGLNDTATTQVNEAMATGVSRYTSQ